jgi:uncharacterized Tic20 family protein
MSSAQYSPLRSFKTAPAAQSRKWSIVVFFIAVLCLLFLLVLQCVGLVAAFRLRGEKNLVQSWCSPAFQLGYEIFDATCATTAINEEQNLGIACVNVNAGPTGGQSTWLWVTGLVLLVEIGVQIFEGIVLFTPRRFSQSVADFRDKHRYKAPVITMFFGVFVMLVLVVIGWIQMTSLPAGLDSGLLGITGTDLLGGAGKNTSCAVATYSGGLRGVLLAWTDGVFTGITGYAGNPPS